MLKPLDEVRLILKLGGRLQRELSREGLGPARATDDEPAVGEEVHWGIYGKSGGVLYVLKPETGEGLVTLLTDSGDVRKAGPGIYVFNG